MDDEDKDENEGRGVKMRTGGVRDGEEEDGCGERRAGATSEVQGRTGRGAVRE